MTTTATRLKISAPRTGAEKRLDWAAAGWAGLIAGGVYIFLEMLITPLFIGGSPTVVPRMIAAIAMGEKILPPPTPFTAIVLMAAVAIHLPLSLVYARILAGIIFRLNFAPALAVGAAFGATLYAVNFYAFTDIFPWFAAARNWVSLLSHAAYGLTAAGVYKGLEAAGTGAASSAKRRIFRSRKPAPGSALWI